MYDLTYKLLLLLLLSCFSRVRLCVTPKTAAHQVPLSLGFSRQEYSSGLPFSSPMHACTFASVVSDSVWPHRQQPTRFLCPWDSPGKNTGVGCHFLLQCIKVKSESELAQSCLTLIDPMDCSLPGSSTHGIFQARVLEWVAIAFSRFPHYQLQKPPHDKSPSRWVLSGENTWQWKAQGEVMHPPPTSPTSR